MVLVTSRVTPSGCVQAFGRRLVLGAIVCLLPSLSFAQTTGGTEPPAPETPTPFNIAPPSRPARPYRGVFGVPAGNQDPRLTLEATVGGTASANNPVADQAIGTPGGSAGGGAGAGSVSANLLYSWTKERMGVYATNLAFMDYYPDVSDNKFLPRDIASAGIYFVPARPTRITFSETFKNLPEFALTDLHEGELGELIPPNQTFGMTADRYTRYGTGVDVSQQLSNRTRADAGASYARGMINDRAWTIVLLSGSVTQTISKGLAVYGGYEYGAQRDEHPTTASVLESHPRINAGVDFNRALSFARRTTLSFSTGTAGVHDRAENRTIYHLVGSVALNREFGRSWNASVMFGRNVRYIEVLSDPLFSDSLGVAVAGSFSRRVELKGVLSASTGHLGVTAGNAFDTYIGSVQLSVAMTRHLAFGSDYVYGRLSSGVGPISAEVVQQLPQQSVRVYLKVWAPLITRPKRS
jgi:hypothetical protein